MPYENIISTGGAARPSPERRAARLKDAAKVNFNSLLAAWNASVTLLWNNDTADILAALGTDAADVFDLSAKTVAFMESIKPGCTTEGRALMRPFTVHADGTVTLD